MFSTFTGFPLLFATLATQSLPDAVPVGVTVCDQAGVSPRMKKQRLSNFRPLKTPPAACAEDYHVTSSV
jgi:hypothetical protein